MNTCPFRTAGCAASVPCNRCRAATSLRNRSIKASGHSQFRRSNSYRVGKAGR